MNYLESGANINLLEPNDMISIIVFGSVDTIKLLIEYGMDISKIITDVSESVRKKIDVLLKQNIDPIILASIAYEECAK